ncbi:tyrosine recombinase XerS [Bacillus sp. AFS001701]|uniref:tyrosine recombinase XerS n=1 Tax=Bacillus sp. AFS001701 TaxID=2033480 RepID=UPI000BF83E24|nr:tyrosine recombinase XerS [Bacillus sp. AFS001701]PET78062.1 tyrosine recombinase XerS [Bacillus sp. AFS001701]
MSHTPITLKEIEKFEVKTKNLQQARHLQQLKVLLPSLPPYVFKYFQRNRKRSATTLFNYSNDYKLFFNFLLDNSWVLEQFEKLNVQINSPADIPFSILADLPLQEAEEFQGYLEGKYEPRTVNRRISALKSLFNYLTQKSEDPITKEPFFYRNVFAKIETTKVSTDPVKRADSFEQKIYKGNEDLRFLDFVAAEYEKSLSTIQLRFFLRDKYRDLAILSLFLGSGLRLSELTFLQLEDINFEENLLGVYRKGQSGKVYVTVNPRSMDELKEYLHTRTENYGCAADEKHVFFTRYKGSYSPLSTRSIQDLVEKYSKAFNANKRLTPHKLRHTFATKHWTANKDLIGLQTQLGHTSSEITSSYTHVGKDKQHKNLENMDKLED